MKEVSDINETARTDGIDAARARHDRAAKYQGSTSHDGGNVSRPSGWRRGAFTAKELQGIKFDPIAWIVLDIIPAEGVTLLCSKPKFGKSWLAYDLCLACTTDRYTLGAIKPLQGDVLYLALEDSQRRLQRRMRKLIAPGENWPERLTIKTSWRRLHEGGLEDIRTWHAELTALGGRPILCIIDVLAKVRKPSGNRQIYEADYDALAGLAKLANDLKLAIVVVHHTRKMAADDLLETVSGSFGVSGAADTVLVMARTPSGIVLDIRGRDVESTELAIEFDKDTCRWRILGHAAEVHQSEQRRKIVTVLKEAEPMSIAALTEVTGLARSRLDVLLHRMCRDGDVRRVGTGLYALADYQPPPTSASAKSEKLHRRSGSAKAEKGRPGTVVDGAQGILNLSRSFTRKNRRKMQRASQGSDLSDEFPTVFQSFTSFAAGDDKGPNDEEGRVDCVPALKDVKERKIDPQATENSEEIGTSDLSVPEKDVKDREKSCAQCGGTLDGHEKSTRSATGQREPSRWGSRDFCNYCSGPGPLAECDIFSGRDIIGRVGLHAKCIAFWCRSRKLDVQPVKPEGGA